MKLGKYAFLVNLLSWVLLVLSMYLILHGVKTASYVNAWLGGAIMLVSGVLIGFDIVEYRKRK